MRPVLTGLLLLALTAAGAERRPVLPSAYFQWLKEGSARIAAHLDAHPGAPLAELESSPGWNHFPYAALTPAVLYSTRHPTNALFRNAEQRSLAFRIGDLLAREHAKGGFDSRIDSWWDIYMWLETYRVLAPELGAERRAAWRRALESSVATVEDPSREWADAPGFTAAFLGTSANHYSLWAVNLLLAGPLFDRPEWTALGTRILHRFALEQSPDGFWGERSPNAPTIGYDHLTMSAVAIYYDRTRDPAALRALRRSTDFHEAFTYPDGQPVETMNDRNRYWHVSAWGQFAFSHFPDGRGYAALLARHLPEHDLDMDTLGRIAQNALYYRDGPAAPSLPETRDYARRLAIPGAIRKTGPWVVSLSGIEISPLPLSQWFLDRQAHVSVWHEKTGLILTGANSKRQPELATFTETIDGREAYLPIDTRLDITGAEDRLSLAYQRFYADLFVPRPAPTEANLRIEITGMGPAPSAAHLALQVVIHPGETLSTGAGRTLTAGKEKVIWTAAELGGELRHHGWTMSVPEGARFEWPVFPYNPYRNGPELRLDRAIGVLTVPLTLRNVPRPWVRPIEQRIPLRIRIGQ